MQDDTSGQGDAPEEPGERATARDGEPGGNVTPLSQRLAEKAGIAGDEAKARAEKAAAEEEGRSLSDRAQDPPSDEELFPQGTLPGDSKFSPKNIIRAGQRVKHEVRIAPIKVDRPGQGMGDPQAIGRSAVVHRLQKIEMWPEWDGERIVAWRVLETLKPSYVQPVEDFLADPATRAAS